MIDLGFGSFRDSGEIEYAADDCYLLDRDLQSIERGYSLEKPKGPLSQNTRYHASL